MSKSRTRAYVFAIKLAVGLGIVYWLIESDRLDLSIYRSVSNQTAVWFVLGVTLTQALSLTLVLGRWWLLVRAQGISISLSAVLGISYRGMFAGLLFPGTIGLDGMRVLHLHQNHPGQVAPGLASMVLDRVLGFLGLLVLAVVCGLIFLLRHSNQYALELLVWSIVALAVLTLVIAVACGFVPLKGLEFVHRFRLLSRFVDALAVYREHHGTLAIAVVLSILAHFLISIASCFGLAALGLDFSILAVATVTPLLIFLRFLPLTPLGLGVTDFAGEELYHIVGIDGGAEVQMLLRATWILISIACGAAYFGDRKTASALPDEPGLRVREK